MEDLTAYKLTNAQLALILSTKINSSDTVTIKMNANYLFEWLEEKDKK